MGQRQLPLLALCTTVLAWLSFTWLPTHASADLQAGFFALWSTPLLASLALRVYAPATSGDYGQRLGQRTKRLRAALFHDRQILDAHPEATR